MCKHIKWWFYSWKLGTSNLLQTTSVGTKELTFLLNGIDYSKGPPTKLINHYCSYRKLTSLVCSFSGRHFLSIYLTCHFWHSLSITLTWFWQVCIVYKAYILLFLVALKMTLARVSKAQPSDLNLSSERYNLAHVYQPRVPSSFKS